MSLLDNFYNYQSPTTGVPLGLKIKKAYDSTIEDVDGNKYLDFISGVSVNNIGHCHPKIVKSIRQQAEKHLHVMVYGEFAQEKPVELSQKLCENLPDMLNSVYLVNSGTEAIEGAIKLAKKATGLEQIISFENAYHGSTNGALSLAGSPSRKMHFAPLMPGVRHIQLNQFDQLNEINKNTAAVFLETIQGDAGVIIPEINFMQALRKRCDETRTLLVLDEIQCGMGRCGSLFAFEKFKIQPDILCLGKALGGGLPIGAFIANKKVMESLSQNPPLGHITTFGGHPLPAATGLAALDIIKDHLAEVDRKGQFIEEKLKKNSQVICLRRSGLMIGVDLESPKLADQFVKKCIDHGLLSFWFLSRPESFRITPPLTISQDDLEQGCEIMLDVLDQL